jgi:hypothetical protein
MAETGSIKVRVIKLYIDEMPGGFARNAGGCRCGRSPDTGQPRWPRWRCRVRSNCRYQRRAWRRTFPERRSREIDRRPGDDLVSLICPGERGSRRQGGRTGEQREGRIRIVARSKAVPAYSITSSARARSACGTVRPSALAVLRLMTSSNLVGCWTGRSAGFAPLRIFPA